jgi:hypothetical protein
MRFALLSALLGVSFFAFGAYIEGVNKLNWWLSDESRVESFRGVLGQEVLVVGELSHGRLVVHSLELYEPVDIHSVCAPDLLEQFLKKSSK